MAKKTKSISRKDAAKKIRKITANMEMGAINIIGSSMSNIIKPGTYNATPLFLFLADCLEESK